MPKPSPELTWVLCQLVFWAGVAWTIYVNYADCREASISAVIAQKATENYWVPAIIIGLVCHWLWPAPGGKP